MKIGIDFHGVIDKAPEFFRVFSKGWIIGGNELHIITGVPKKVFTNKKISYTHFYSITDDFLRRKLPYCIDKNGNPSFNENLWNKAKARYCKKHKISLMIDDSKIYGRYFSTPYFKYEMKDENIDDRRLKDN